MTRLLIILPIIAIFFPDVAVSERVRVQSGEHDNFSRLVMVFSQPTDWRISTEGKTHTLTLTRKDIELDTRRVFELIPQDRIARVITGISSNILIINTNCNCKIQPFELNSTTLVIDIVDHEETDTATSSNRRNRESVLPPLWEKTHSNPSIGTLTDAPVISTKHKSNAKPYLETSFEESLRKAISKSAADGLITPSSEPGFPKAGLDPSSPGHEKSRNIRMSSAIIAYNQMDGADELCNAPVDRDIASWGREGPWDEQIAGARSNLINPTKVISSEDRIKASRQMIYLTFGMEALQILDIEALSKADFEALSSLSRLIDNPNRDEHRPLEVPEVCTPADAFWYIAFGPSDTLISAEQAAIAINYFDSLPIHLRRHLGPAFKAGLGRSKEQDAVAIADRILARSIIKPGVQINKAQQIGRYSQGILTSPMERLLDSLRTVEKNNSLGIKSDKSNIEILEALLFELSGSESETRILDAILRANIIDRNFQGIREKISKLPNNSRRNQLQKLYWKSLINNSEDTEFLHEIEKFIYDENGNFGDPSIKRDASRRALEIGVPEIVISIYRLEKFDRDAPKPPILLEAEASLEEEKIPTKTSLISDKVATEEDQSRKVSLDQTAQKAQVSALASAVSVPNDDSESGTTLPTEPDEIIPPSLPESDSRNQKNVSENTLAPSIGIASDRLTKSDALRKRVARILSELR